MHDMPLLCMMNSMTPHIIIILSVHIHYNYIYTVVLSLVKYIIKEKKIKSACIDSKYRSSYLT